MSVELTVSALLQIGRLSICSLINNGLQSLGKHVFVFYSYHVIYLSLLDTNGDLASSYATILAILISTYISLDILVIVLLLLDCYCFS